MRILLCTTLILVSALTINLKGESLKTDSWKQDYIHECGEYPAYPNLALQKDSRKESAKMTKEEQEQAISTLLLYAIPVDSSQLQRLSANAQIISQTHSETDFDTAFFNDNISHLDSVINNCVELTRQNKGAELLDLLEKERLSFYASPNNVIDNEVALHQLFIMLYGKFYDDDDVWSKIIPLIEFSKIHILGLQMLQGNIHPYYPRILYSLVEAYSYVGDTENAITSAKELCDCSEAMNDTWLYYGALLKLHDLYDLAGMGTQADSCLKIIEASPDFQDFKSMLQEQDQ